ncbi:phage tail fiber C-terminal domain-containing protein [Escherichia coli]|uniref:phage tail fiber C-terminal domain-containing protein n=1 Tax=Escherichia coli TaxID=562 RepID=UPI000A533A05|nr:phage tail fiber C-terminal domain-containing protein [Escherichia coli]MCM4858106.1 phage tail fiber C-terminal domain-containing protein [Escherichia coli]MCM4918759.1 phage tail fiber C-terminal domain-containing protein [Escherichia coli]
MFIKSPVLCCGENITFHQVAKFSVPLQDADKKQIQCVVRPLQILRADGTWENIGGMK